MHVCVCLCVSVCVCVCVCVWVIVRERQTDRQTHRQTRNNTPLPNNCTRLGCFISFMMAASSRKSLRAMVSSCRDKQIHDL